MSRLKGILGLALSMVCMLAISACTSVSAQTGPTQNLTILHTNNVEGELDPCTCLMDSAGGAPRRSTAVSEQRTKYPDLFLVDSGDALFGTIQSDANGGIAFVKTMNQMRYDAAALGDREFMYGLEILQAAINQAEYPYLSANVVYTATKQPLVHPAVIIDRGGYRLAFLGLTSEDVDVYLKADPAMRGVLEVLDPIKTARARVAELNQQADAVIVLSDLGSKLDRKLINAVSGITAVIGGHSREMIQPDTEHPYVPIVQMGFQGDQLGVLHLEVNGNGKTTSVQTESIRLSRQIPTDEKILSIVMPYKAQVALEGLIDFSSGLSSLLPLEVHRADRETQQAYLAALAYPELFKTEPYPGSKNSDSENLLGCFIRSQNPEENAVEFSLLAISEPGCVLQANTLVEDLPELVLPTRVANP